MKVLIDSPDDIKCINWLGIADRIGDYARKQIADAITKAGEELKTLKPGEHKTFVIQIGEIEISRELDSTAKLEAEVGN